MAEMEKETRKESNGGVKEDGCDIDIKQLILDNQRQRRPSSLQCCIYRAHVVCDVDIAAFTPNIVSIGPLHHSQPHLKAMEETKINYLEQFLQHAANTTRLHEQNHLINNLEENNIEDAIAFLGWKGNVIQGGNDFTLLGQLLDILRRSEQDIRSCYAENLNAIDSEEFFRLVLVDVAFIIELFLRLHFCSLDPGLEAIMLQSDYQLIRIRDDLWLLEIQLPYFILENLYVTAFGSYPQVYPPFLQLTFNFFVIYNRWEMKPEAVEGKGLKHFTDLIRALFLPSLGNCQNSSGNMVCLLRDHLPSATQLHDAGVRFVETEKKSLVDINYSESDGRLEIPSLYIWDETARCFRNIIVLEQYHYPSEACVSDYFTLMDYLINTSQDADLLMREKVIKHWLGSSSEMAGLFNSLCTNILKGRINPHFFNIIEQLNRYHSRRLNRWKATLRQQYFSSPFRGASTIGGIILLVLTLVQAILAALDLKFGP